MERVIDNNARTATSRARPIILTFAGGYLPGFKAGGPIRSLANMVAQLGDEFDFHIVAPDRDLGDLVAFDGVAIDAWNTVGKAQVFYRSPSEAGWRALIASLRSMDYDLIYLNSFFSVGASLRPLFYQRQGKLRRCPVLLAPRGEFSPGALAQKPLKKRAFIGLSRALNVYRNITFQASSEHEAVDIARALGAAFVNVASNISVASDLSHRPDTGPRPEHCKSPQLRAAFLSRVSPKKNLDGALSILKKISIPIHYDIYGPIENTEHWNRCLRLIDSLPCNVTVEYKGVLHPEMVEPTLEGYDFFFLPTLGENYGHVIREALSAGLPVLISDQTPWRDLHAKKAGADLALDEPETFVAWIEAFSRLSPVDQQVMRDAAHRLGNDPIKAARDLETNRAMLHTTLGRSSTTSRPVRG